MPKIEQSVITRVQALWRGNNEMTNLFRIAEPGAASFHWRVLELQSIERVENTAQ